eukprot:NODE_3052_length_1288_cov_92.545064_g2897_i0.p1 GENE.NODE_3052_length_1288_cov_92.545064_g2897_i0~~NODE_3052_length_1288_cov_92.545064_g2897_i0.p1  ORF type:complete len:242 (-),score=29.64 NODE_3052_length_1288_cov_92.545064_g2897_i0:180-905(-)
MFNHSCDPNCHLQWVGGPYEATRRLVMRATCFINPGTPLTISYGPHKNRHHSVKNRRQLLAEQYNFYCECAACMKGEEGTAVSDENRAMLQQAADLFRKGRALAGQNRLTDGIAALTHSLEILQTQVDPASCVPRHIVAKTQDAIAELLAMSGDLRAASSWCQKAVNTLEAVYSPNSLEMANEYDKLAGLCFKAQQPELAIKYIDKAVPLLTCFYGDRHEGVRELSQYRQYLLQQNPELAT